MKFKILYYKTGYKTILLNAFAGFIWFVINSNFDKCVLSYFTFSYARKTSLWI